MAVVAHQYPYSIPSLADTLPDFPALVDLDIDHAIERGTPLDQANLDNARLAVRQLQVAFESPVRVGVTADMVQRADFRLKAVEAAHVSAIYNPHGNDPGLGARILDEMTNMRITLGNMQQNVQQKLDNMQQKLDNMQQKLDDMQQDVGTLREEVTFTNAIAYNHGVISRNVRNMPGSDVQALKKTIPGHDMADRLEQHFYVATVRGFGLTVYNPPKAIGELPPGFKPDVYGYDMEEIAQLMIFYNDGFGIKKQDTELECRRKVMVFLTSF